jgi:hypothetical protein
MLLYHLGIFYSRLTYALITGHDMMFLFDNIQEVYRQHRRFRGRESTIAVLLPRIHSLIVVHLTSDINHTTTS